MSVQGFNFDGTVHKYEYGSLQNIPQNLAQPYSTSATYAVGDYCTYNNVLYKCTTAISTAESWTSGHWSEVKLGSEIGDLKSAFNVMEYGTTQFDVVLGTSHSSTNDQIPITIKSGETYYIRLKHSLDISVDYQVWCYYTDGTAENVKTAETNRYSYDVSFTPNKDVVAAGIYTLSNTPTGTITVEIYSTDSVVLDSEEAKAVNEKVNALSTDLYGSPIVVPKFRNGTAMNAGNTDAISTLSTPVIAGDIAEIIINRSLPEGHVYFIQSTVERSSGSAITSDLGENTFITSGMPTNAIGVLFSIFERSSSGGEYVQLRANDFSSHDLVVKIHPRTGSLAADVIDAVKTSASLKNLVVYPTITNGSGGNPGNANAVTARAIPIINNAIMVSVKNTKPVKAAGNYYKYTISAFRGSSWYTDKLSQVSADKYEELIFNLSDVIAGRTDVDGFGVTVWEYNSSGTEVANRLGDFDNYPLTIRYVYDEQVQSLIEINREETDHYVANARHVPGNTRDAVTLLHFSDIHADAAALTRIITDAKKRAVTIDDKICTGDITANTNGEIASWWDASVMTCMGNHDTASYSDGVYNWTALSMANRDAYYIAPFESNWGVTHTSGTSYYYKDYTSQKLRLIVMDGMLYNSDGAETTAQTSWLEGLLSDAITNSLHVLIAIHAPHGGASAVDCSFSKYSQTAMPTYTDCNTPQTVIDVVAAKITAGLKFVGYIVGHTHQDNVWDASGDGKQLMYCITCAAVATKNQWKNSDQDRSITQDAYNLVTIDTANTLVKIVRCGGADIDDKMRTRKAICFNYSTGTKVGEVL